MQDGTKRIISVRLRHSLYDIQGFDVQHAKLLYPQRLIVMATLTQWYGK
jgi:hypothetical protein